MNIESACQGIISLYRNFITNERAWSSTIDYFERELQEEMDCARIEACILSDKNWELSVDLRLKLLEKAKFLGAKSRDFKIDYFGYKAAHLDPGPEKYNSDQELENIINNTSDDI